jgi:DNA polymerase III epsilon subunit-like protein
MLNYTAPWHTARLVAVDVEGNGAHPAGLVELAIVPITEGTIREVRSWMVRPASPITWQATKVHGITNEDVSSLPPVADVADVIRAALGAEAVLVAHNAHVDLDVIIREIPGWEPAAVIDTLKLSRRLHKDRPSHKLGALIEAYGLEHDVPAGPGPHRAAYDALMAARLLQRLIGDAGLETLGQLTGNIAEPVTDALF